MVNLSKKEYTVGKSLKMTMKVSSKQFSIKILTENKEWKRVTNKTKCAYYNASEVPEIYFTAYNKLLSGDDIFFTDKVIFNMVEQHKTTATNLISELKNYCAEYHEKHYDKNNIGNQANDILKPWRLENERLNTYIDEMEAVIDEREEKHKQEIIELKSIVIKLQEENNNLNESLREMHQQKAEAVQDVDEMLSINNELEAIICSLAEGEEKLRLYPHYSRFSM